MYVCTCVHPSIHPPIRPSDRDPSTHLPTHTHTPHTHKPHHTNRKTRRIRLRPGELERKGVGELKRLLEQLGVPTAVRASLAICSVVRGLCVGFERVGPEACDYALPFLPLPLPLPPFLSLSHTHPHTHTCTHPPGLTRQGCLEKGDMVQRLLESGLVEIVTTSTTTTTHGSSEEDGEEEDRKLSPPPPPPPPAHSTSAASASSSSPHDDGPAAATAEEGGKPLAAPVAAAGSSSTDGGGGGGGGEGKGGRTAAQPPPVPPAVQEKGEGEGADDDDDGLDRMSVGELRRLMQRLAVSDVVRSIARVRRVCVCVPLYGCLSSTDLYSHPFNHPHICKIRAAWSDATWCRHCGRRGGCHPMAAVAAGAVGDREVDGDLAGEEVIR